MAVLYVTEFSGVGIIGNGGLTQVAAWPANAQQFFATSAASAQSAAFQNNTQMVRIHNDVTSPVCITFGTNPTAVTGQNVRLAANQTEYFTVPLGAAYKVAAVTTT